MYIYIYIYMYMYIHTKQYTQLQPTHNQPSKTHDGGPPAAVLFVVDCLLDACCRTMAIGISSYYHNRLLISIHNIYLLLISCYYNAVQGPPTAGAAGARGAQRAGEHNSKNIDVLFLFDLLACSLHLLYWRTTSRRALLP